jgi:hypothetical protein
MDRERLIDTIKLWMQAEDDLKQLQSVVREKRKQKKILTDTLVEVMRENDIDEFNVNSGKLVYTQNRVKSGLSKKLLLASLGDYFKDDPQMASQLAQHILDSRTEKIKETIKQK